LSASSVSRRNWPTRMSRHVQSAASIEPDFTGLLASDNEDAYFPRLRVRRRDRGRLDQLQPPDVRAMHRRPRAAPLSRGTALHRAWGGRRSGSAPVCGLCSRVFPGENSLPELAEPIGARPGGTVESSRVLGAEQGEIEGRAAGKGRTHSGPWVRAHGPRSRWRSPAWRSLTPTRRDSMPRPATQSQLSHLKASLCDGLRRLNSSPCFGHARVGRLRNGAGRTGAGVRVG
jgi:hypothetical protein